MKSTTKATTAAAEISNNNNGRGAQTTVGLYGPHLAALVVMQRMRRFPRVTDVVRLLIEDAAVANGIGTFERGEFVVGGSESREQGAGSRERGAGSRGQGEGNGFAGTDMALAGHVDGPAGAGSAAGVVAQRASGGVRSRRPYKR